jgi:hypothetical protein
MRLVRTLDQFQTECGKNMMDWQERPGSGEGANVNNESWGSYILKANVLKLVEDLQV